MDKKITATVIQADVGGSVGPSSMHEDPLAEAKVAVIVSPGRAGGFSL